MSVSKYNSCHLCPFQDCTQCSLDSGRSNRDKPKTKQTAICRCHQLHPQDLVAPKFPDVMEIWPVRAGWDWVLHRRFVLSFISLATKFIAGSVIQSVLLTRSDSSECWNQDLNCCNNSPASASFKKVLCLQRLGRYNPAAFHVADSYYKAL